MKYFIPFFLIFMCVDACSQDIITQRLVRSYIDADLDCYTDLIQHDLNQRNKWICDTFIPLTIRDAVTIDDKKPLKKKEIRYYQTIASGVRQTYMGYVHELDLRKEKKRFFLSITLEDAEGFQAGNNIYNHITIDSTRTFIIACMEDSTIVKGLTDLHETGLFLTPGQWFGANTTGQTTHVKEKSHQLVNWPVRCLRKNDFFQRLFETKVDALLYWPGGGLDPFLYIKNGKIFVYQCDYDDVEFQEFANRHADLIRLSSVISSNRDLLWLDDEDKNHTNGLIQKQGFRICK